MTIPHLFWADTLVAHIAPENNEYGTTPTYVYWAGVDGSTVYKHRTLCNTFVVAMLKKGYGLTGDDIRAWLGSSTPKAAVWHDAIVAQNGFLRVARIGDIQPGDFLAIKYPDGLSTSGHIAIVKSPPVLRAAGKPVVKGTSQYEVVVFDAANSGHGATDTRRRPDGSWVPGAGAGAMRIYADSAGKLAGYSWSTLGDSVFYAQSKRHLAVGRLNRLAPPA